MKTKMEIQSPPCLTSAPCSGDRQIAGRRIQPGLTSAGVDAPGYSEVTVVILSDNWRARFGESSRTTVDVCSRPR